MRIVCATNRDPQAEVNARRFRADLFYRLHVLPLHLPPLRERGDDIMKLANAFLKRYSAEENRGFTGFSPQARQFLQSYDWPGNVRQLENLVRRIVVMHDGETVEADMIPLALAHAASPPSSAPAANANDPGPPARGARTGGNGSQGSRASAGAGAQSPIEPFWMQERRIIESALEACGGHVGQAAAALGISASTIYRKKMSWDANAVLSA